MPSPSFATSGPGLEEILQHCRAASGPPMPWLVDPAVREAAQRKAQNDGTLDTLLADPLFTGAFPAVTYSSFRDYRRTGNRMRHEAAVFRKTDMLHHAAAVLWLGGDARDRLQDLLWDFCEATRWTLPAHEEMHIDLVDAQLACGLAEIITALGAGLDGDVTGRVRAELRRRIFDTFLDPGARDIWRTLSSNWNAVCHGGIVMAALLCETRALHRETILRESLAAMPAFLDGFTPDGGCTEGPSYWTFGFGWFTAMAEALCHFTGGALNLFLDPRVEKILRYFGKVSAAAGQPFEFADATPAFIPPNLALSANAFLPMPELFTLCPPPAAWRFGTFGNRVHAAALLKNRGGLCGAPAFRPVDSILPDLNVARLVRGGTVLGAKGGANDEHHNHNDLGSFVLFRGGVFYIAELGAPVYTRHTFGPARYENAYCSAAGHSVPRLNGVLQADGSHYTAPLAADFGAARLDIDLSRAYPDGAGVEKFTRRLILSDDGGKLVLEDSFAFCGNAPEVCEQFITFQAATLEDGDKTVVLDNVLRIRCESHDGGFAIGEIADCRDGDRLRRQGFRLAFTPRAALGKTGVFRFSFTFTAP